MPRAQFNEDKFVKVEDYLVKIDSINDELKKLREVKVDKDQLDMRIFELREIIEERSLDDPTKDDPISPKRQSFRGMPLQQDQEIKEHIAIIK